MMKWFSRKKKVVTDEGKKTAAKKRKPDDDAQVKEEEAEEKYDSVFTAYHRFSPRKTRKVHGGNQNFSRVRLEFPP